MAARPHNRRRAELPRDSRLEELQETKQLYTDYFGELRKGFAQGYDPGRRANIIDNTVHPKHGRWRGMQDPYRADARRPQVARPRAMFAGAMPQAPGGLAPRARRRLRNAYSATFRLDQNFAPAHVTFRKILGHGGFGVAALFGLHESTGREVTVVVKADLRPDLGTSIRTEKRHMILMAGARHMVQRTLLCEFPWPEDLPERYEYHRALLRVAIKLVIFLTKVFFLFLLTTVQVILWLVDILMDWIHGEDAAAEDDDDDDDDDPQPGAAGPHPDEPNPQPGPIPSLQSWKLRKLWPDWPAAPPRALGIDGAIRQNRQELDARQDIISMEFLKCGDLGKWIGKMTCQNIEEPESVFSEKVAWVIFECLWRGCVALAHPTGFHQGMDAMTTQIPQITESIGRSSVGSGDPLVHFDLDPQNIFVGDFDADHEWWPLTKIGDLGLSIQTKSQVFVDDVDEESKRWWQRRRGKRDSLLPEQYTEEWDYIPSLDALRGHEVAGNYDAHSNIYHIGLTMFELMTLTFPDDPPFARPYSFRIDRQTLSGWTYGHHLLGEDNPGIARQFSAELRHTVAWCMEHNPMERPSLSRLGQIVERNAAADFPGQPDADDAPTALVGDLLGSPLPPTTRNDT